MSIEELAAHVVTLRRQQGRVAPPPISDEALRSFSASFESRYGRPVPNGYVRILRVVNGVHFNGLTIWPGVPTAGFKESIVEANEDLRDTLSDQFLYFGQYDEELYVLDLPSGRYQAIELVALPTWERFNDDEAMFEFMLERALGPFLPEKPRTT